MKIALAQMRVTANNPKTNFTEIKEYLQRASLQGAQVLVFPEMCVPGYFVGDTWERAAFLHECEFYGQEIARAAPDLHVFFGNVGVDWTRKNEDGRVRKYNAVFYAHGGNLIKNHEAGLNFWPKTLMPNYREFDDSRHFYDLRKLAQERDVPLAQLLSPVPLQNNPHYTVGLSVCEDGWAEDYSVSPCLLIAQSKSCSRPSFYINISCSPFTLGKQQKRERVFGQLAATLQAPLFYTNCVGAQNLGKTIFGFDGQSTLFNSDGSVFARASFFKRDLLVCEVSPQGVLSELSTPPPSTLHTPSSRVSQIHTALEYIVSQCCTEWGITRVVVGASGGIDSALSATLFARVLGPENVYLVNMPSRFNSELTQAAAAQLAQNLGCPYAVVPIEAGIHQTLSELSQVQFRSTLNAQANGGVHSNLPALSFSNFVFENIQARDRSARILAGLAASLSAVFSCNANKAELTVGYSTLYGDQAGFLAPLADLWKGDVYALASYYNTKVYGSVVIPQSTLDVMPSAELSTDQDVLQNKGDPLCYPYHDRLFESFIEHWERKSPFELLTAFSNNTLHTMLGCPQELIGQLFKDTAAFCADLERWWGLYAGMGAFKRVQAPPVVAVTRRAFGNDHRESVGVVKLSDAYLNLKAKLNEDKK